MMPAPVETEPVDDRPDGPVAPERSDMQRVAGRAVESIESLPPPDDAVDIPGFIEPEGDDNAGAQRSSLPE